MDGSFAKSSASSLEVELPFPGAWRRDQRWLSAGERRTPGWSLQPGQQTVAVAEH